RRLARVAQLLLTGSSPEPAASGQSPSPITYWRTTTVESGIALAPRTRGVATRGRSWRAAWAIVLAGGLALLTGCATIVHGPEQQVSIASTPANAQVLVNGMPVGTTPVTLDLARSRNHVIR